jgi:hypothetical protein
MKTTKTNTPPLTKDSRGIGGAPYSVIAKQVDKENSCPL